MQVISFSSLSPSINTTSMPQFAGRFWGEGSAVAAVGDRFLTQCVTRQLCQVIRQGRHGDQLAEVGRLVMDPRVDWKMVHKSRLIAKDSDERQKIISQVLHQSFWEEVRKPDPDLAVLGKLLAAQPDIAFKDFLGPDSRLSFNRLKRAYGRCFLKAVLANDPDLTLVKALACSPVVDRTYIGEHLELAKVDEAAFAGPLNRCLLKALMTQNPDLDLIKALVILPGADMESIFELSNSAGISQDDFQAAVSGCLVKALANPNPDFDIYGPLLKEVNFSKLWAEARKSGITDERFTLVLNRCLVQAAERNDVDLIRILAEEPEVDVNFCDPEDFDLVAPVGGGPVTMDTPLRQSPLIKALIRRRPEAALLLLELGANPNWTDAHGWKPLDRAIRYDLKSVEEKLGDMDAERSDEPDVRAFADKNRGR